MRNISAWSKAKGGDARQWEPAGFGGVVAAGGWDIGDEAAVSGGNNGAARVAPRTAEDAYKVQLCGREARLFLQFAASALLGVLLANFQEAAGEGPMVFVGRCAAPYQQDVELCFFLGKEDAVCRYGCARVFIRIGVGGCGIEVEPYVVVGRGGSEWCGVAVSLPQARRLRTIGGCGSMGRGRPARGFAVGVVTRQPQAGRLRTQLMQARHPRSQFPAPPLVREKTSLMARHYRKVCVYLPCEPLAPPHGSPKRLHIHRAADSGGRHTDIHHSVGYYSETFRNLQVEEQTNRIMVTLTAPQWAFSCFVSLGFLQVPGTLDGKTAHFLCTCRKRFCS